MTQRLSCDYLNGVTYPSATGAVPNAVLQVDGAGELQWVPASGLTLDPALTSIAGLSTSGGEMLYTTAGDTYATSTITAFGRSLVDDADASTARGTLGVQIGSDVQAFDAKLNSISGLTVPANTILYANTTNAFTTTTISAFGRTLIDDADASTARGTLSALGSGGSSTNNAVVRWDGTGGLTTQDSGVLIDDSDNITGVTDLAVGGNLTVTGTVAGLTQAELTQLQNIGANTINSTQWVI